MNQEMGLRGSETFTEAMRPVPQLVSGSEVSAPRVLDPSLPVSLNFPQEPWGQNAVRTLGAGGSVGELTFTLWSLLATDS